MDKIQVALNVLSSPAVSKELREAAERVLTIYLTEGLLK